MSPRALRWLLWLAAVFVLPLPILAMGPGRVPAGNQIELGLLALAFGVLESMQGITLTLAASFLLPGLLYAALLWLPAWLLARGLSALPPTTRTRAALLIVMLGVGFAIARPIYLTPFSAEAVHATLLELY